MKIAYLLGSLNRGGAETLLLDVFKNVSKANFDFIGIHRKDGALKNDFYATGQKLFKLAPRFPYINYFVKLRKILIKENVQVVHAQQFLDAFLAKIATFGTKIKIVQTYHGFEKDQFLLRFIIRQTDKNFFVSNYQREIYTEKYSLNPEKQATIYNGISFDKFEKKYGTPDFLHNNTKRLKMAMVGNFVSVREHYTICKFLKLLHQKGIDFDFYFIGKKDDNEAWRYDDCVKFCNANGLIDCVHFLGTRNDVPAILQNIDAFVYSTDHDTFGIAVIEAIALGLPVFVNDWVVMSEITNNGEWATLYKTKDETDLLIKFMLFLQDRSQLAEKTAKASLAVRNQFSIEKHLHNLNQEYNSVC